MGWILVTETCVDVNAELPECNESMGPRSLYVRAHTQKRWAAGKHVSSVLISIQPFEAPISRDTDIVEKSFFTKHLLQTE